MGMGRVISFKMNICTLGVNEKWARQGEQLQRWNVSTVVANELMYRSLVLIARFRRPANQETLTAGCK